MIVLVSNVFLDLRQVNIKAYILAGYLLETNRIALKQWQEKTRIAIKVGTYVTIQN
jgi:hypothetical protein